MFCFRIYRICFITSLYYLSRSQILQKNTFLRKQIHVTLRLTKCPTFTEEVFVRYLQIRKKYFDVIWEIGQRLVLCTDVFSREFCRKFSNKKVFRQYILHHYERILKFIICYNLGHLIAPYLHLLTKQDPGYPFTKKHVHLKTAF